LGKYRGGSGLDITFYIHPESDTEVGYVSSGKYFAPNQGLMGGYPGPCAAMSVVRNTNFKDLIAERKPLPSKFGSHDNQEIQRYISGDFELGGSINRRPTPASAYTIFQSLLMGGSGFGDPLEREPELVLRDVVLGLVSLEAAECICGVKIKGDLSRPHSLNVDWDETEKFRERIKEERKKSGIPAKKYIEMSRDKILKGDIPKYSKEMINRLLAFSPHWASWFKKEWGLPENFKEVP
jgi:N-methylhydantoinase B/oxoprolinase/acetone carboxylase alpha subunit